MNYGAEPADQVVRYTLEGTEFALKISGTAAKNFAVFALAVLRDQKKTHGKTKLVRLLREGKPLKFFSVPTDQMRDFAKAAKSHGLLYVPIRDRSDPDILLDAKRVCVKCRHNMLCKSAHWNGLKIGTRKAS